MVMNKLVRLERRIGYSVLDEHIETLGEVGLMSVICERMMEGFRPTEVARRLEMPWLVMWEWVSADPKRQEAYDRAHEAMAQEWHRETIEIADGVYDEAAEREIAISEATSVARLRIDTRLKVVGNYDKRRFGQNVKVDVEHTLGVNIKDLLAKRLEKLINNNVYELPVVVAAPEPEPEPEPEPVTLMPVTPTPIMLIAEEL